MSNHLTNKKQEGGNIILIITIVSTAYAILRYNIVGDVPWKDLPLFIINKAISLAALILLTLNFSLGPLKNRVVKIPDSLLNARKSIGIVGFLYAFIHILMSITILNPHYYHVFFMEDGTLSVRGGLSLLGGILSFIFLWVYNVSFKQNFRGGKQIAAIITSRKFLMYAMLFTGIHLFFMGYSGWTILYKWQGGLPPISLISFVIFSVGYFINLVGRK